MEVCEPKVPTRTGDPGDQRTPRTVFWPTPEKAISALGEDVKEGDIVYLYSPLTRPDPDSVYQPAPHESPLLQGLGEIWYLTGTRLGKPERVILGRVKAKKTLTYYDPRRHDREWITWEILRDRSTHQSKAIYLSPTDLGPSYTVKGSLREGLWRTIGGGAKATKPGKYWLYKPDTSKIPVTGKDEQLIWSGTTLRLVRSGQIQVDKGGGYKTL